MAMSQRGRAIGMAASLSADYRRCEKCGRRAAMISFRDEYKTFIVCRWAKLDKCDDKGIILYRDGRVLYL